MTQFLRKLWIGVTALFRLHLGVNNIVGLAVTAWVLYVILHQPIGLVGETLSEAYDSGRLSHTIVVAIISSILAAMLFGVLGVFLMSWYQKTRLTGKYDAYVVEDAGNTVAWGIVRIRFFPFSSSSTQTPVKMQLKMDDVVMDGDGLIIDNRYLVGYYTETGRPERRRSGSFMYELDGTGRTWEGTFVAVDPDNKDPVTGTGRWIRR